MKSSGSKAMRISPGRSSLSQLLEYIGHIELGSKPFALNRGVKCLKCVTCIKIDFLSFDNPRGVSECFCFAPALSAMLDGVATCSSAELLCVLILVNNRQQSGVSRKRESAVVENFVKI